MVIIWADSVGGSLARWTENPEAKVRLLLGPQYIWRSGRGGQCGGLKIRRSWFDSRGLHNINYNPK